MSRNETTERKRIEEELSRARDLLATTLATFAMLGALGSSTLAQEMKKKQGAPKQTLYRSLGGKKAITAVVNDFVGRVAADKRINGFFAATAEVNNGERPWGNVDELHLAALDRVLAEHGADLPPEERRRLVAIKWFG